ncbi:MAG: HisA/HisF-related TIM barrel protein [Enterobacterales bacterium]|nr:HisA/HisF-related TIM barrel protein [Enterobacterales bacterium]
MLLIPVLEVRQSKSVHTEQMTASKDKIVTEDPIEIVGSWVDCGISRIHFVDVDAIQFGEPCNVNLLRQIKEKYPDLIIQVTGGIKSLGSAFVWMDAKADFLLLNGKAMRQKNLLEDIFVEFPDNILVEIDSRQGAVGMGSGEPCFQFSKLAKQLEDEGVVGLVVTEIPATGHVNQSNLLRVSQLSESVTIPVFANGGIESFDDLKSLLKQDINHLDGILIGKLIYHKDFDLQQAQQLLSKLKLAV